MDTNSLRERGHPAQPGRCFGDVLGDHLKSPPTTYESSPFSRLVDDCVSAGLLEAVLPVIPPNAATAAHLLDNRGKIPGQYLGSVWCGLTGWTKHLTTPANVARWRLWPDAGLCIRTAVLRALDIDVEAPELASVLDALVRLRVGPGALVRTRGSSPRLAFLFRVDGPVWKRRFAFRLPGDDEIHAVELLGGGQQLVLAGQHPSGMNYGLEAPGLSGRSFTDIAILTLTQLDELWEEIQATITAAGGQIVQNSATTNYAQQDRKLNPEQTVMREIVRQRERWVPPLLGWGPGKAGEPWRISGDGLGRDDLEEDLAIYPDGIYDFGTERSHDPISLIREFGNVGADGEIEFGGSPEYGERDGQPYAVIGEWDSSVRRPSEGEALAWLSRQLGGPAIPQDATRASAMPALAEAVGQDWEKLEAAIVERHFDQVAADQAPPLRETEVSASTPFVRLTAGRVTPADLLNLPPRQWLYGYKLSRRYVTFLASPGGVGKTAFTFALALACASHKRLLHDTSRRPLRVWLYNLEDDVVELRRRLAVAIKHYSLDPSVLDNIRMNSGRDRRFRIVAAANGALVTQPDYEAVIAEMRREAIDILIVDPFLRSHGVPENENEAQDEVMRLYAQIAEETNAGILLVHHTKKGAVAGELDSLRGGSTQAGGARAAFTLAPMSVEEAEKLGIPDDQRRLHVRIDDAKNNMAPPVARAEWLKLESVSLDNGDAEYPNGDNVQVATAWTPSQVWDGSEAATEQDALAAIEAGIDGERYSIRPQDTERWAGNVLMEMFGCSSGEAKHTLVGWAKSGAIEVRDYHSEEQRKKRKGVFVTETYRPADNDIFG